MAGQTTRVKDSGANYVDSQPTPDTHPARSVFDLSYLNVFTASEGELLPVGYWEVLPDSDYDFDLQCLIRVQPLTVPIMSRMRVFFHAYYLEYSKLWRHWQSFYSKGHSRTYTNSLPSVLVSDSSSVVRTYNSYIIADDYTDTKTFNLAKASVFSPVNSVYPSMIGAIPSIGYSDGAQVSRSSGLYTQTTPDALHFSRNSFNLLGLFAIQHIYRDYYLNQNLHRNDTKWFPDDPHDFILQDVSLTFGAATVTFDATFSSGTYSQTSTVTYNDSVSTIGTSTVTPSGLTLADLFALRYRDWTDDYFTTATPTPVYGDEPSLTLSPDTNLTVTRITDVIPAGTSITPLYGAYDSAGVSRFTGAGNPLSAPGTTGWRLGLSSDTVLSTFTLDQLRTLAVNQLAIEKMTRTDGSYGQFMKAFFGSIPSTALDYRAQYIGGCYQPIQISEVLQTSESSSLSPLGEQAGHGSSAGSGRIGHLHTTEYGCVVIMMSIMPDTYYAQGQNRWHFADLTQEDYYLSGREELGPDFIRNRELYNGMRKTDIRAIYPSAYDPDGVYGYQGRYDFYRFRHNEIHGRIGDSAFADYRAYTQARIFNSQPTLSQSFLTTEDSVSDDMFVAPDEPHFVVEVANMCRAVQPLPYHAIPGSMIH